MSKAFAAELERDREGYNARFAHARRQHRGLEGDDFRLHLTGCVDPIVAAVAEVADAGAMPGIVRKLYDLSLDLVGRDLAGPGARFPVISRMWAELLPRIPGFVADAAHDIPAALTNAVYNLSVEQTVDAQPWLDAMLDIVDDVESAGELLAVGQVLAWTYGMAHYRESALQTARGLRPALKTQLFGCDDLSSLNKRWGGGDLRIVGRVGGFRGFGGPFICPPEVVQRDGQLYVFDNERCWTLHADQFGATIKRFGTNLPEGKEQKTGWKLSKRSGVKLDGAKLQHDDIASPTSWAATPDTLAVTVDRSHHLILVGR